MMVSY